jgi:PucR family transcriptional regulator, purine catabolism regulatory protein
MNLHKGFILWYEGFVAITVKELVSMPDLRTRVLAGVSGIDREVSWAHVCELPDPTEYLAHGELLMTVGFTIPEGSSAQKAYIERLAEVGLSGLLIAEQMYAPELSAELISTADRLSLPVLLTAYSVPFTAIARTVAEANRGSEHQRLLQAVRVYETARLAVGSASGSELMAQLGDVTGCDLFVLDPERGHHLLGNTPPAPEDIVGALTEEMARRSEPMPAVLRLRTGTRSAMALFVPASRPAAMVAMPRTAKPPDLSVLRHVATIAALEVEKLTADYERKRRLGAELLAGLIDSRIAADSATHLLSERNLSEEPRLLACCAGDGGAGEHSDLHLRLEDRGIPHLLLRRAPLLTALLPATTETVDAFREEIDAAFPVGLSDPIGTVSRVPDAYREAVWALRGAKASGKSVTRYGEDAALSPFLPRSLSESRRIVEHVLGSLLDYDAAHDSQLTASLKTFLCENRSWQRAAASLHIHKQTLVYRMRRVEELTGRRLDRTEDVAELWFALQAAEASGSLGSGSTVGAHQR